MLLWVIWITMWDVIRCCFWRVHERVHEIVSYTQLEEVCVDIVKPNGEKCGEHAKDEVELKLCRSVCIKWMKC